MFLLCNQTLKISPSLYKKIVLQQFSHYYPRETHDSYLGEGIAGINSIRHRQLFLYDLTPCSYDPRTQGFPQILFGDGQQLCNVP